MGSISTIGSKGQVTLPVEVRNRLGVKSGDKVEFYVEEGKTMLRSVRAAGKPLAELAGAFPVFKSSEEHDAWFREIRGDQIDL